MQKKWQLCRLHTSRRWLIKYQLWRWIDGLNGTLPVFRNTEKHEGLCLAYLLWSSSLKSAVIEAGILHILDRQFLLQAT